MLGSEVDRRKALPSFFFLSIFFFLGLFNSVSPVFGGYDGVRWALLFILPSVILLFLWTSGVVPKVALLFVSVLAGVGSCFFPLLPPSVYLIFEAQYWFAVLVLALLVSIPLLRLFG